MPEIQIIEEIEPLLADYISCYRNITGEGHIHFKRLTPQPGASLIFDFDGLIFNERAFLHSAVVGIHTCSYTFRTMTPVRNCFVVRFSAYGLSRFTGISMPRLRNDIVDAEEVFDGDIRELYHALECKDLPGRIHLVEQFLLGRLRGHNYAENCIFRLANFYREHDNETDAASLMADILMSRRHLERQFKGLIGIDMSTYKRICRFEMARKVLTDNHQPLAHLAYDLGYYDSAHFSRDFKRIASVSPGRFTGCMLGRQD